VCDCLFSKLKRVQYKLLLHVEAGSDRTSYAIEKKVGMWRERERVYDGCRIYVYVPCDDTV
jgi:hypothetical protein